MAQSEKFWTNPKKVALVVILAVIVSILFGCAAPISTDKVFNMPIPTSANGDTDAAYLQHLYETYNEQYFNNHLTRIPKIDVDNHTARNEADTGCDDDAIECTISFNLHFTAAPRTAQSVLLHEMCHIKVWKSHVTHDRFPPDPASEFYHDRSWRSCMLALDAAGAFRVINIDFYREDIH